ncbi:hypothetical protein EAE99_011892 [Botrytis elliptica]|nr:hypothetical protein EAE99_011892 [Botrytis elliptica]
MSDEPAVSQRWNNLGRWYIETSDFSVGIHTRRSAGREVHESCYVYFTNGFILAIICKAKDALRIACLHSSDSNTLPAIASGTISLSFKNVSYPVNDNILVLPAQSSFDSSNGSIIVKSAALTSTSDNGDMTAVLYVPTEQEGTISPKIVQQNVALTSFGPAGAYILYSTGTIKVASTGTVIVRVAQDGSSSRTVKSTTFASYDCVGPQKVDIMWLGNESPHFGVGRIIGSQSYRYRY